MDDRQYPADVVQYLVDVGEAYSPARFRLYLESVRPHVPQAAYAELEAALERIVAAGLHVDQAVRRLRATAAGGWPSDVPDR
jgi:hypothetical protein